MRFSESIKYDIPKPIKNAISDSSPFKSDESLSDDISLPDDRPNLSPNDFSTQTPTNTNLPSNINSPSQPVLQALGTNHYSDRTRHPSQNQSPSSSITNNRDTKLIII